MKKFTTYSAIAVYLEKIFRDLNKKYFADYLKMPFITVQSSSGAYGHFMAGPVWRNGDQDGRQEINISAEWLSRPIENVVATMIHEMVHMFAYDMGIKDTSRGNTYHNKKFKAEAEKRGLIIEYDSRIGWSLTTPSPDLIAFVRDQQYQDIVVSRANTDARLLKKPSSTRKYHCPCCGMSVRATKTVRIMCMDCQKQMEVCG